MQSNNTLTSSPLLLKNTILNLVGYGTPLIFAVFSIPLIVKAIGTDRFGILTIAWVLTGYLSLLDMGLGRALTKIVAEKLGENHSDVIPRTIWTALIALFLISICIGLLFGACSRWVVFYLLKIPAGIQTETLYSFYLLSAFVPIVVISVGFRGILEAHQRFDLVNIVRIPLGAYSFLAPLAVIPFSVKLYYIIAILFFGRSLAALVQFLLCCKVTDNLIKDVSVDLKIFGELIRFGGWMTITNIISPLLVYLDRFFIGALISTTAVAYYATPSEVITKLTLVSGALMSVIFPAISASYNVDRERTGFLVDRGLKYVFIAIFPIILIIFSFTFEAITFWLSDEFAHNSKIVAQLLSFGILFTCIGQIPYAFIQGAGRPDLTGKLHMLEMPVYILFLAGAIHWGGIAGAAIAWAFRATADTILLYSISQTLLGKIKLKTGNKIIVLAIASVSLALIALTKPLGYRILECIVAMTLFTWITIQYFLSKEEKDFVKSFLSLPKKP